MSDSEEEYDITKSIGFASGLQADSDSSSSESESGDYEVQDEIISSSEEEEEPVVPIGKAAKKAAQKAAKKAAADAKPAVEAFPSMELDGDSDNDSDTAAYFTATPTKKVSVGTFSGLGFSKFLLRNIIKKGFKHPTPIQRKTIPLVTSGRDLVGMARTGSGKTAAFVLPMLEKLKVHSAKIGARAIILSPSRELALQTLKVVKDFCKGTDLRTALIVGGDSFDEQFKYMMSNPDIIIATPGRFLHLKVEMKLDLKSMEYVVFDEADRLFEMGFAEQLNEIIASLPPSRQTLLFSATLPKNLVEFAKAGLQDPVLVRLDADTKISENLQMAYFAIKREERDAGLAYILREIIQIPPASPAQLKYLKEADLNEMESDEEEDNNKGKGGPQKKGKSKRYSMRLPPPNELPTEHSTIVFTPTKHHVEYVTSLLNKLGYACSYIYGTLDQRARKDQLYRFRCGYTSILIVTDVAARGIDIPILANVVNYSLPGSSKVFVHRVGRTARAGRKGWAYSLVSENEVPYVLDLELFLGRKLLLTADHMKTPNAPVSYTDRMVLGAFPRNRLEMHSEEVAAIIKNDYDISCQRDVALKGEKLYLKTRSIASLESIKRAKALLTKDDTLNKGAQWDDQHLLFGASAEKAKEDLLAYFGRHKQKETVFEFGNKSGTGYQLMARRWKEVDGVKRRAQAKAEIKIKEREAFGDELDDLITHKEDDDDEVTVEEKAAKTADNAAASEADLLNTFEEVTKKKSFRDPTFYMSHYDPNQSQEKGFSLGGDSSFAEGARNATFDISGEGEEFQQKQGMKWDKKKGKYINAGSIANKDGQSKKWIRSESGQKIHASFRSGIFDTWKKTSKTGDYKVGALETSFNGNALPSGRQYKHNTIKAPKAADRARDDYHVRKVRVSEALDKGMVVKGVRSKNTPRNEIKAMPQMVKERRTLEQKKEKNARPNGKPAGGKPQGGKPSGGRPGIKTPNKPQGGFNKNRPNNKRKR